MKLLAKARFSMACNLCMCMTDQSAAAAGKSITGIDCCHYAAVSTSASTHTRDEQSSFIPLADGQDYSWFRLTRHMAAVQYLCPTDLRSGSILHQVVNGHAAHAPKPCLQILHTHAAVGAQCCLRPRALHMHISIRRTTRRLGGSWGTARGWHCKLVQMHGLATCMLTVAM